MTRRCLYCKNPAEPWTSRCEAHRRRSNWTTYTGPAPGLYTTRWWREVRAAQLTKEPYCRSCGKPATDVDHVTPIAHGGALDGPLQSLCRRCHQAKTSAQHRQPKDPVPRPGSRPAWTEPLVG